MEVKGPGFPLYYVFHQTVIKPPLLIFKGKKGGKKEIEIQKNLNVKNRKIYVLYQENSWEDSEIFHYWLEKIFFNNM